MNKRILNQHYQQTTPGEHVIPCDAVLEVKQRIHRIALTYTNEEGVEVIVADLMISRKAAKQIAARYNALRKLHDELAEALQFSKKCCTFAFTLEGNVERSLKQLQPLLDNPEE